MREKNKRRGHNCNEASRGCSAALKITPVKPLDGETILARFNTFKSKRKAITPEDIIHFISTENARAIALAAIDPKNRSLQKECGEFLLAFMKEYGKDRRVMEAIAENWGEDGPRVFRLGACTLENGFLLTKTQTVMRDQLVDHIFTQNTCRTVTLTANNPDGSLANQQFRVPKDISKKDMPGIKKNIGERIGYALMFGGSIVLRFHSTGKNGKDVMNGFLIIQGTIVPVPAEQMRAAHETMPDGTRHPDESADYQTPRIIFTTNRYKGHSTTNPMREKENSP